MNKEDFIIKIHHIGGIDECGPVDALISLKQSARWFIYDADNTSLNQTNSNEFKDMVLINKCIGNKDGKTKFYVVKRTTASSCLPCEPKAKKYYYTDAKETWGEHVKVEKVVELNMNKLDTLIKNNETTIPDFLSVDVQGLELDTIKGCKENLDNVLGIICEVEFRRLYKGQALFRDTDKFLTKNNFLLEGLFNIQHFNHNSYAKDKNCPGFLCVAEALYFKDHNILFRKYYKTKDEKYLIQLIKLAMFALSYSQTDLAKEIVDKLDIDFIKLRKDIDISYLRILQMLKDDTLDVVTADTKDFADKLRSNNQ